MSIESQSHGPVSASASCPPGYVLRNGGLLGGRSPCSSYGQGRSRGDRSAAPLRSPAITLTRVAAETDLLLLARPLLPPRFIIL